MRKIILIFTFLSLALSSPVNANEIACKAYDIPCKMKKFGDETKSIRKLRSFAI